MSHVRMLKQPSDRPPRSQDILHINAHICLGYHNFSFIVTKRSYIEAGYASFGMSTSYSLQSISWVPICLFVLIISTANPFKRETSAYVFGLSAPTMMHFTRKLHIRALQIFAFIHSYANIYRVTFS